MRIAKNDVTSGTDLEALRWGAAHAFDIGGVLLDDEEWGGFEADARALFGDWRGVTRRLGHRVAAPLERR